MTVSVRIVSGAIPMAVQAPVPWVAKCMTLWENVVTCCAPAAVVGRVAVASIATQFRVSDDDVSAAIQTGS